MVDIHRIDHGRPHVYLSVLLDDHCITISGTGNCRPHVSAFWIQFAQLPAYVPEDSDWQGINDDIETAVEKVDDYKSAVQTGWNFEDTGVSKALAEAVPDEYGITVYTDMDVEEFAGPRKEIETR